MREGADWDAMVLLALVLLLKRGVHLTAGLKSSSVAWLLPIESIELADNQTARSF